MTLDLVQTVAFAGLVLFAGYWVKRRVPILSRYNIPAPVVGGLPVAAILALLYAAGRQPLAFDTALQTPLQNVFFASVGFGASVRLLRRGGPLVAAMMVAGVGGRGAAERARRRGGDGARRASAASACWPARSRSPAARRPGWRSRRCSKSAGVPGAATLAVSAAMVGIVSGGLLGGPIGTLSCWAATACGRLVRPACRSNSCRRAGRCADAHDAGWRRRRSLRAAEASGGDADGGGRRRLGQRRVRGAGLDAAGLHRRDGGRGHHPQCRRRAWRRRACRSARSTTWALWRCRSSWSWR